MRARSEVCMHDVCVGLCGRCLLPLAPHPILCLPPMQVPPTQHKPGTVVHTMGYPLGHETYGGGFIYHMADNKVCGAGREMRVQGGGYGCV